MSRERAVGPRRRDSIEPTEREWSWLAAAPGHNPFIGFGSTMPRMLKMWGVHGAEIRELWGDSPPDLPFGHPAGEHPGPRLPSGFVP